MNVANTIQRVVQYFQYFHDSTQHDVPQISSHVWTFTDFNRWKKQHPYEVIFTLLLSIYQHRWYYFGAFVIWDSDTPLPLFVEQNSHRHNVGTVTNPDIPLLKKLGKLVRPNVWEIDNSMGQVDTGAVLSQVAQDYCGTMAIVHELDLTLQKVIVIETGGYLELLNIPANEQQVVVVLSSKFQGGELTMIVKDKIEPWVPRNKSFSWVAAYFHQVHGMVTSGTQVLLVCSQKLNLDRYITSRHVPSEQGPIKKEFNPRFVQLMAQELEGKTIGVLLSDKYNTDSVHYSSNMLAGVDRILCEKLIDLGCRVEVKSVMYCRTQHGEHHVPLSQVYSWSTEQSQYLIGQNDKPLPPAPCPQIPFFDLGLFESKPVYTRECWEYDLFGLDEQSLDPPALSVVHECLGSISYYLVPALVIRFPNWWTRARLLWIARKKNSPAECPIAQLPTDVVRIICEMVRVDLVQRTSRKQKRKRSEDDIEDSTQP